MIFGLSREKIRAKMENGEVKIAVYGIGRVGLPLAVAWLRTGQSVIGVDIKPDVVDKINDGVSPIADEPGISRAVEKFVSERRLRATSDLVEASRESDAKFVCVPTTMSKTFDPGALMNALKAIAKGLKKGDAVSIESSVPPTTTETLARTVLEEGSGLKAEKDFALAFCPERVFEGRVLEDLEERYPKIVGGIGPQSTALFATLYRSVAKKGTIEMESATAAELVKLFEGIYRDANIALANELARVCEAFEINYDDIAKAANSQSFCHLHRPGVGVGGFCLPYYPHFVMGQAVKRGVEMPLTRLSREINEGMPGYAISKASEALARIGKEFSAIKTAILGLAFRGDVADSRNSPTYYLVDILKGHNARMMIHDPMIESDEELTKRGVQLTRSLESAVRDASLVIVSTDHSAYKKIDIEEISSMMSLPAAIIDGRNILDTENIPDGIYFTGIGRKTINKL